MTPAKSLYGRLLVWLSLPLIALGSLLFTQAWRDAQAAADRAFDRLLQAATLSIAEQVQWQDDRLWLDLPPTALQMLSGKRQERVFYTLVDGQGRYITGNARLPAHPGEDSPEADTLLYQNTRWRGMAVREGIRRTRLDGWRDRKRFAVRVAHTREGRTRLASDLWWSSLATILGMGLLSMAMLLLAVRAALAPLTRLRYAIRARHPRSLSPLALTLPRELAELREVINQLLARMRRVRANQERFIGDASHQLRTPLAGIAARAELALRQTSPGQWHDALVAIHASSERTGRLATQLLSLTRLENPEYEPAPERIDLNRYVRRALHEHWPAFRQAKIDLGADCAETPVMVDATPWQLEEALNNLLDNAGRYGADRVTLGAAPAPPRRRPGAAAPVGGR
ncbi:sensor histidine kinase [Halomonas garicola]|uniref:sensor histidine kinase n=1 Tax=Halomonas garicola TaxID=1690008 RepID=UPI002898FEAC|nr:sensor histidine kinase [Halomonas garicola]